MTIAFDSSGLTTGNGVTSLVIDITTAAVGAFCYCFGLIGINQGANITFTGWTLIIDVDEGTADHMFLYRRQKQSGDTTFTASWGTAEGSSAVWLSYTGLNTSTPDELSALNNHSSSGTAYVTSSLTPNAANRWSLVFAGARSTTSANQPESFTSDAALTQRKSGQNSASRWSTVVGADSNGAVTQAAHSYTETLSAAEGHGGASLTFLIPSTGPAFIAAPPLVVAQAVNRTATY